MSEYVTDPALLEQLNAPESKSGSDYITDPALLEQLNGPTKEPNILKNVAGAVAPAISAGPTGLPELGQKLASTAEPFVQGLNLTKTAGIYKANPLMSAAIEGIGMSTLGFPPIAAAQGVAGLYDRYQGAVNSAKEGSKIFSEGNMVPGVNSSYPETVPAFRQMQKAEPGIAAKLSEIYHTGGGNNGVKAWLSSPEAQGLIKANPEFASAAKVYGEVAPGIGTQAMRVAGPILRGAGKVLGPVGMGYNVYEAGQMARDTGLGQRLAGGEAQRAPQAFRQMNPTYGAPLNAQQAQNVLQSGSPRDIQSFGGQEALNAAIRKEAAMKALTPGS